MPILAWNLETDASVITTTLYSLLLSWEPGIMLGKPLWASHGDAESMGAKWEFFIPKLLMLLF